VSWFYYELTRWTKKKFLLSIKALGGALLINPDTDRLVGCKRKDEKAPGYQEGIRINSIDIKYD
jgi:hypothetical protein